MFVKNYSEEFIKVLQKEMNRVTMFANKTVDSLCTVKIMRQIFRINNIPFSFIPVENLEDLTTQFNTYKELSVYFLLINCGGTLDILHHFDHPANKVFFVLDTHRPTHITNIYNETNQIRLLQLDSESDIPTFDQIFRDDPTETDDEEEEDPDEDIDARIAKKEEKRAWLKERDSVMYHYTLNTYFGTPSSVMALQMAYDLSCVDVNSIWLAIVGLTEYQMLSHYQEHFYNELISKLGKMNLVLTSNQQQSRDMLKINEVKDVNYFLYRQWNVYESMKISCVTKFQAWTRQGESQFHQFLVRVGLPLKECNQNFPHMDRYLRKNFLDIILNNWKSGNMDDMTFKTFESEIGFNQKISASDSWFAAFASLYQPDILYNDQHDQVQSEEKFFLASDTLNRKDKKRFQEGLYLARNYLTAVYKQIQVSLEMDEIIPMGTFLYLVLRKGTIDHLYFSRTESLRFLGTLMLRALVSRKKRMIHKPLIIFAPTTRDNLMVIGIRPVSASPTDNIFGKVFENAEESIKGGYAVHHFDRTVLEINASALPKFLETVIYLMKD